MAAPRIETGSWVARWGEWEIVIHDRARTWSVEVWSVPDAGTRRSLGKARGLDDAQAAIDWASSLITSSGARVFVSGKEQPLAKFLSFVPSTDSVS